MRSIRQGWYERQGQGYIYTCPSRLSELQRHNLKSDQWEWCPWFCGSGEVLCVCATWLWPPVFNPSSGMHTQTHACTQIKDQWWSKRGHLTYTIHLLPVLFILDRLLHTSLHTNSDTTDIQKRLFMVHSQMPGSQSISNSAKTVILLNGLAGTKKFFHAAKREDVRIVVSIDVHYVKDKNLMPKKLLMPYLT